MALFVLCLAMIDIIILLVHAATEAARDNLGVELTSNRELPEETFGASPFLITIIMCLYMFALYNHNRRGYPRKQYIGTAFYTTPILLGNSYSQRNQEAWEAPSNF